MKAERIISADSHVTIRDEAVLSYMPAKLRDDFQRSRDEYRASMAKRAKKKPAVDHAKGQNPSQEASWAAAGRPGEFDPVARLEDMDIDGVEAEVLYCTVDAGASFNVLGDAGREAAFQAFCNAALEFASRDPKRLLPVYPIPVVDVEEGVREVTRLAEAGARALMLPLYPADHGLPPYWDPSYDRLWAVIQETGIPISQHVDASQALWRVLENDPTPAKGIFQSLPPLYMSESIAGWIVSGLLERFPTLKVIFVEAGLGWLPFYLERLDRMYEKHGWREMNMLPEVPSFYWRRQMAATFEEDEFGVENRDRLGVENLMWASDYPHPDCTWPDSQQVLKTHFDGVPEDEARLMIGGNAARFYRL